MNMPFHILLTTSMLFSSPIMAMISQSQATSQNNYEEYFAHQRAKINKHLQQEVQQAHQELQRWDPSRIEEYKQQSLQKIIEERKRDTIIYPLSLLSSAAFIYVAMQSNAPFLVKLPLYVLCGSLFSGSLHQIIKTHCFTVPVTMETVDQMVQKKAIKAKKHLA